MLILRLILFLVLGVIESAKAQSFVPPPDRRVGNQLKKIYSVLSVGMDLNDVWRYLRVGYPNGKIQNMNLDQDFSDVFKSGNDLLIVSVGEGGIHTKYDYLPQVSLLLVFEKKDLKLLNAQYVRYKSGKDRETNKKPLECSVLIEDVNRNCKHK